MMKCRDFLKTGVVVPMTQKQAVKFAESQFADVVKVVRFAPSSPLKSLYASQWIITLPENNRAMIADFGDGKAMLKFNWSSNYGWHEMLLDY